MPNKCVVCGKIHEDNAKYLIDGCDKCGSKFFFFIKEKEIKKAEEDIKQLTKNDINEIENDLRDILAEKVKRDETVILDFEAIRILKPGKYKIDITNLLNQRPIVIRVGPGRYRLDLSSIIKDHVSNLQHLRNISASTK